MRRTILLVEDDTTCADIMSRVLRSAGYEVIVATEGFEALALVRKVPFDLYLLDYELPNVGGIDLARAIRANPATSAQPVAVLTGHSDLAVVKESIAAGIDDFIVKPSDRETILSRVRSLIG